MIHKISVAFFISIIVASCSSNIPLTPIATSTSLPTAISTLTSTPTLTPSPTWTPTPFPTSIGGTSGKLIFTYYKHFGCPENEICGYEKVFPDLKGDSNIFISNWDGTKLTPITKDGFKSFTFIEAISPDGKKLLVLSYSGAKGADLYLVDLDNSDIKPQIIAHNLFPISYGFGNARAAWIDNSSIVYIGLYGGEIALWRINLDGTNRLRLSKSIRPWGIFSVDPQTGVVWRGDTFDSIQISSLDGTKEYSVNVNTVGQFAKSDYSPNGKWIFWQLIHATAENPDDPTQSLYVSPLSNTIENPKLIADLPSRYWTITFSVDGTKAVFLPMWGSQASDPSLSNDFRKLPIYVLSLKTLELKELPIPDYDRLEVYLDPAQSSTALSPDGKLIVITSYDKSSRAIEVFNLETYVSSDEFMKNISVSAISSIFWLP